MKKALSSCVLVASLALGAMPALAVTGTLQGTAPLQVTAVYAGNSTFRINGPLDFGFVGSANGATATTTISYSGPQATITLNGGLHPIPSASSAPGQRQMVDPSDPNNAKGGSPALAYELYQDPAHTLIWGGDNYSPSGSATTTGLKTGTNTAVEQTFTVYGLIAPRSLPSGTGVTNNISYSDTVTMSVYL